MNIRYKKYHILFPYTDWEFIYSKSDYTSPFVSPEIMRLAITNFYPYYITKFQYPTTLIIYDNEIPVFGCVLVVSIFKRNVEIFGNETGFNFCSPIWIDEKYIPVGLELLQRLYGNITLHKIREDNPILFYSSHDSVINRPSVNISFDHCYDLYFNSLTKSVRQNIRTAYNRLHTDGQSLNFIALDHCSYKNNLDQILFISNKRHYERYGHNASWIKKLFLKYLNFATIIYKRSSLSLSFLLKIDNKPAAFMSGLLTDNRYIVPRLAIDIDFKRYSPGLILINEAIKYFIENGVVDNLDLSFGEEKYKFDMGGGTYKMLSYRL